MNSFRYICTHKAVLGIKKKFYFAISCTNATITVKTISMIFKRKLYQTLLNWKTERKGKTAILIEGPRRVGKSTLAESFAQNEYETYIKIDFSIAPKEVNLLFEDISNLDYLFMRLQFIYKVELKPRKSVIIFDEVQKQPLARQAIKHLVKDRRFDYIETGSLISIKKNVKDILIPSEETRLALHPMTYEEFKWALGDTATIPLMRLAFEHRMSLTEAVSRRLMRDFRLYMLIGGMPQAVEEYLESNNLSNVDAVKRDILKLYHADFKKIDPTGRMSMMFDSVPAQLNNNALRYQVSSIDKNSRTSQVLGMIAEMVDSGTVKIAYHANDPSVGFALHKDLDIFKLYLCDTGLFITLAFWDKSFTYNTLYQKLLNDKMSTNLGYVYENVVAQMLVAEGNELFYHTFPSATSHHKYEIDFLLSRDNKICPVEVKSSTYKRHASFDAFCKKFSSRILHKYIVYTKDLQKEQDILYLPAYMVQFL